MNKVKFRKGVINTPLYIKKLDFIFHRFPWYHEVFMWYTQGKVSEREVFDAVNYLIKLNKTTEK